VASLSSLDGYNQAEVKEEAGSWVPLVDKTRDNWSRRTQHGTRVSPMIISPGHLINLETSIRYVLACSKGYRLPEPTRQADKLSKDNAFAFD